MKHESFTRATKFEQKELLATWGIEPQNLGITYVCSRDSVGNSSKAIIVPLRPRLVAPKKSKSPTGGSPRLKKHPRRLGEVTIAEREVLVPSAARAFFRFPDAHSTATATTTTATTTATKTESV
ncbi:hypothetical protein Hte_008623 [Hypoxylon texense]